MPTSYVSTKPGLEFRKPAAIFGALGWLAAGVLNPAGWFAYMVWGMPSFDYTIWAWHTAVPLEIGLLLAMLYVREAGFGIGAMVAITVICIAVACAGTGPIYTLITWVAQQFGISVSFMGWAPIYSTDTAIAHTGTYIRASLAFCAIAAVPAALILRIVALQRIPRRATPVRAKPSTPPQAPAA